MKLVFRGPKKVLLSIERENRLRMQRYGITSEIIKEKSDEISEIKNDEKSEKEVGEKPRKQNKG